MAEKRIVPIEEIEREREELEKLRRELTEALRHQYYLARMRTYWERRLATYEARLAELRRIGWVYLRAPERAEWRRLRDVLIPRARERVAYWRTRVERGYTEEITPLREKIREAEEELARKIPPILYRVKIRLYNEEVSKTTPTGQFQGWFDIDAVLDETGMPKWDWWLTEREIRIAKRDMWAEFNAPESWPPVEGTLLAYMKETEGIAHATPEVVDKTPVFKPRYPKGKPVPEEFRGKFTIEELIVGLSSVAPEPTKEPEGVWKEKIMVIKEDEINYYSEINDWVWHCPRTIKERVKRELGI